MVRWEISPRTASPCEAAGVTWPAAGDICQGHSLANCADAKLVMDATFEAMRSGDLDHGQVRRVNSTQGRSGIGERIFGCAVSLNMRPAHVAGSVGELRFDNGRRRVRGVTLAQAHTMRCYSFAGG